MEENNRKELTVVHSRTSIGYVPKYLGGGELPAELQGLFTSEHVAWIAINSYLHKKGRTNPTKVRKENATVTSN
jgi:hypothetical protein